MSTWHGNLRKKKASGGIKRGYRKKRNFECGSFPIETKLGEFKNKTGRRHGGNLKVRLLAATHANISNPSTGKTEKAKILSTVKNIANADYDRRGVITKGAIIETGLGTAQVTSRPGQDGLINAVLIPKEV